MKSLLAAYIVTGLLLLLLAVLLYKLQLAESQVNVGITAIYILSSFLSGFLEGKMMKTRKFLWGAVSGLLYFVILALVSLAAGQGFDGSSSHFVTTLLLCVASGTLGGMVFLSQHLFSIHVGVHTESVTAQTPPKLISGVWGVLHFL